MQHDIFISYSMPAGVNYEEMKNQDLEYIQNLYKKGGNY